MNLYIKTKVTDVNDFECPRKIQLQMLATKAGFRKEFEFKSKTFAGSLLHSILQDTFIRYFSFVEYYYSRKNKSIIDSIYLTYNYLLDNQIKLSGNEPLLHKYDNIVYDAINIAQKMLWNMADLAKSLVIEKDKKIYSKVLKDEFSVYYNLEKNVRLAGKIDLLAIEKDHLRVIELKTGGKYPENENQLRIYGEIMKKSFSNLKLELWYVDSYNDDIGEIISVSQDEDDILLKNINLEIIHASNIKKVQDLPPMIITSKRYKCNFCKLCFVDDFANFFPNTTESKNNKLLNYI